MPAKQYKDVNSKVYDFIRKDEKKLRKFKLRISFLD